MKKYISLMILSFCFVQVQAQDPNWSVNAPSYQYSMTFTAVLNINGETLSSSRDKVAAFVNEQVRGVANIVYVASINKYVVFLSVYANTNRETIHFKIYDSANDVVVDITETENFVIDGNLGGVFQSYSIASPTLSSEAVLNSFAFSGIATVSQTISADKIDIVLPSNTDLTNLIVAFHISTGASFFVATTKQISGTSSNNFTNTVNYKLLSENEAVLVEYAVNVTLENPNIDAPALVLTSNANALLNQAPVIINVETNVAISGFTVDDILLENAIVTAITKMDDLNYSCQVVPIQQGGFSIQVLQNAVFNDENEVNLASNKLSFRYDFVNPYILSIKRKNPMDEIISADTLEFTVTFNEPVDNVFAADFVSIPNATFSIAKETDSVYTVTLNTISNFMGAVSLHIKPVNTIQDKTGNLLLNSVINAHQN